MKPETIISYTTAELKNLTDKTDWQRIHHMSDEDMVYDEDSPEITEAMFAKGIMPQRPPTHPGERLRREFLIPLSLTQQELAEAIRVPRQTIEELVQLRQSITPSLSLRLAKFLGMSADFWLNLQLRWDLYYAQQVEATSLETIRPFQLNSMRVAQQVA